LSLACPVFSTGEPMKTLRKCSICSIRYETARGAGRIRPNLFQAEKTNPLHSSRLRAFV
jgi:hypothetical protein